MRLQSVPARLGALLAVLLLACAMAACDGVRVGARGESVTGVSVGGSR